MANKYSRYELQPFPSLYVDNQGPAIAQLLAQRYDANKTSKDLIDRTLSQLELLDGDKAHLERVKTEVKGTLKDHIEKQDWENSSLVVADAAQLVETDAGLIAANKSMQNRQAEIAAVREAKLNGIPMLDFGADARKTHQSYYYDEETGSYITNVYEPMMETQHDYRSRKEAMIGKIPASQRGSWAGVSRGKTNRTANLMVEQYISDTKEGAQEYRKLVEIDLPQSLPLEERMQMAKAQILMDFKEVARQQEFSKYAGGGSGSGKTKKGPKKGIVITTNETSKRATPYGDASDKTNAINKKQLSVLALMAGDIDEVQREALQIEFNNNNKILNGLLDDAAKDNGELGENTRAAQLKLEKSFMELGPDGEKLLAATKYVTFDTDETGITWEQSINNIATSILGGGAAGGLAGTIGGPASGITIPAGIGIGATLGFGWQLGEEIGANIDKINNVRSFFRPQEVGFLGIDDEREQMQDELWGDEDFTKANVDNINEKLGTNFKPEQLENLLGLTDSWYTLMTGTEMKDEDGNTIERMSGDDLYEAANNKEITSTQPLVGFGTGPDADAIRSKVNKFAAIDLDFLGAGITAENMVGNETANWIAEYGGNAGVSNIQFKNVGLADVATNEPLRLTFDFKGDGTGASARTFTVTDPTILQPEGWLNKMLTDDFGLESASYDELMRQQFNRDGYSNTDMNEYTYNIAEKHQYFYGGTDEDKYNHKRVIENQTIMVMLTDPSFTSFHENTPNYANINGVRGLHGQNGFIPFIIQDSNGQEGYNEAALMYLQQNKPKDLQNLRDLMLKTSLQNYGRLAN